MKAIFLDVDGVLNSHAYFKDISLDESLRAKAKPRLEHWLDHIDPKAVARLNRLIDETAAKIVISSSWRHAHNYATMHSLLKMRGLVGEVIGETPFMNGPRGHEIASWLGANPHVKRFVIFDDGKDAGEGGLAKWFIQTSLADGLQNTHVERAIHILGRR